MPQSSHQSSRKPAFRSEADPAALLAHIESMVQTDPREAGRLARDILERLALSSFHRAEALRHLAMISSQASDYDEAGRLYNQALDLYDPGKHQASMAQVLGELGMIEFVHSRYLAALDYARRSLAFHTAVNNNYGRAVEQLRLGIIMQHLGDLPRALEYLLQSYEFLRHDKTPKALGGCLNNLALVYKDLGQYDAALEYFQKCLKISIEDGNLRGQAHVYSNLGVLYHLLGKDEEALEYIEMTLDLAREIGDLRQQAIALMNHGTILFERSRFDAAVPDFEESQRIAQQIDLGHSLADALIGLARCHLRSGRFELAADCIERARPYVESADVSDVKAVMFQALCELNELQGNYKDALHYHERFHQAERDKIQQLTDEKLSNLRILRETEQARDQAEIHRLENVELAAANVRLERLIRSKNEFLGLAAHDLRNPLSNILGLSRLICELDDDIPADELRSLGEDILTGSDRMLRLLSNLLELNRIDQGHLEVHATRCDLWLTAEKILMMYHQRASAKNIKLRLEGDPEIRAWADHSILATVIDNLVSNAVKFSPAGTEVTIQLGLYGDSSAPCARLEVRDQGPGLTAEDQRHIFGTFARLSAQPTDDEPSIGLGLAIVKHLVAAMRGSVWCESEHGHGACFIVELPLEPEGSFEKPA